MSKQEAQFMRLALALIRKHYRFGPQRRAVAAKMYVRWLNRKKENEG